MSDMVFCRGCGKEIHNTAPTCPSCGAPQMIAAGGKSKVVAAILAFFLGGFGVHRFYLGKWWGIFYLLFFWTFIPGFVAFIEAIVFLCTSDKAWDDKYNGGRPSSGSSGAAVVIAVVVCLFVGVGVIGILAAIAVPAYQDYTIKAKLIGVEMDGRAITTAFTEYYDKNNSVPADVAALGVTLTAQKYIKDVDINQKNGIITITVKNLPMLNDDHLVFVPRIDEQKNMTWTCSSDDIKVKYLSPQCRNQ